MKKDKKYTMLIVDDEPIISDGLKDLFEESFGDIFSICNCYHPKRALEIFKYRLPDVVVSDVRMPKMTGIEMAEKMRSVKQDIHVLFLSGYDEFDYVYSAIKQDADDYILKTEGDDIILAAMKKMVDLLESENLFREEFESARSRISYMAPAFKEKALGQLLDGDIGSEEAWKELMADLENPVSMEGHLLMLLGAVKNKVDPETQKRILTAMEQTLMRVYGNKIACIHKMIYRQSFVWLLETEEGELPELLQVTLLDVQKMLEEELDTGIAFGIAGKGVKWNELAQKHSSLWTEMLRQTVDKESGIVMERVEDEAGISFNGEETGFEEMVVPVAEKIHVMEEFLSGGDREAFMEEMEKILSLLSGAKRHSMYALEIYYSIANMLIAFINRRNLRARLASKIRLMELFDPGSFVTWEQAADYIRALMAAVFELSIFSGQSAGGGITERTKSYILSHLGEDLSLTAIGQEIGFNPIYLSRVFKQAEGIGIREYVENCRMDMAKRLILHSRMKIYEIAERCGYSNTAYFIKVFKAHFGFSPQETRNKE